MRIIPSFLFLSFLESAKNLQNLYRLNKKLSFNKKLEKNARQGIFKSLIYAPQRRSDAFVAQLDRALASGAKGRKFESCRARQVNAKNINGGYSSVGRAPDCDSGCRGFKSH